VVDNYRMLKQLIQRTEGKPPPKAANWKTGQVAGGLLVHFSARMGFSEVSGFGSSRHLPCRRAEKHSAVTENQQHV
jgi:hypothetical protein